MLRVIQVDAILDHAILDPAQFGIAGRIIVGVERNRVVVGLEDPVPHGKSLPGPEMHGILHPLDVYILHNGVFEGADLDGEVMRRQVEHREVINPKMLDIEEPDMAIHAHDRGDVLPAVQTVAADMQTLDMDIFVVFARQRTPVEKDETGAYTVRPKGLAKHYTVFKRHIRPAVEQQGPADRILTRLANDDAPAAVQAALEGLGVGQGVIARQEAVTVGIFHVLAGAQGQQRSKRQRNQSIFHNACKIILPSTSEAVPFPADPHPRYGP